ncbi:MAG: hypothetical protein JJE04_25070 [Acidobacteriia bacterium]|nr:hypothetical protein [Terriglobia bacterium]
MNFEQAMAEVKDTLVVMAEIQRRQAEVQKLQAQELDGMREGYTLHEKRMVHVDQRLAEITDKLDGLIGYQNLPKRPS